MPAQISFSDSWHMLTQSHSPEDKGGVSQSNFISSFIGLSFGLAPSPSLNWGKETLTKRTLVQLLCQCWIPPASWQDQSLLAQTPASVCSYGKNLQQKWGDKCTRENWPFLSPLQNPRGERSSTYALLVVKTQKKFPILLFYFFFFPEGLIYTIKCKFLPPFLSTSNGWWHCLSL